MRQGTRGGEDVRSRVEVRAGGPSFAGRERYAGVSGAFRFVPGQTMPPRSPTVTLPQRAA